MNIIQQQSVRQLLSIPIIRALCISGASLCFTATAFDSVFVLFCYTPISDGGLDFSVSYPCPLPKHHN